MRFHLTSAAGVLFFCLSAKTGRATENPPPFLQRLIAEIPSSYVMGGGLVYSEDGGTVAFPVGNLDQWAIMINDDRGRWFDSVGQPFLGPDGRTVLYTAKLGNRELMVKNHIPQSAHTGEKPDEELAFDTVERFVLSDDSRVVYAATKAKTAFLVIEQAAYPLGPSEKPTEIWFDPFSGAVVCVTEDSKSHIHVYLNGHEDAEFRKIGADYRTTIEVGQSGSAVYLAIGKPGDLDIVLVKGARKEWDGLRPGERTKERLVYCARKGNQVFQCFVDMNTLETTETLLVELPEGSFEWTADAAGANVAYAEPDNGKTRLVIKGQDFAVRDKGVDLVDMESLVLDPPNKAYAYRSLDEREYAVVKGKKGKPWDLVSNVMLSREGITAYKAERDGRRFVVADGKPGPAFDDITDLAFGPDGKTVHYKGARGNKVFLVIGDRETTRQGFDEVKLPGYSSDGRAWAYRVRDGEQWRVIASGAKEPPFHMVEPPMVSPSGRTLAYVAHAAQGDVLVVNGEMTGNWDWIFTRPLFSPEGNKIAFGALRGHQIVWRVVDAGEGTR